jgi:hypothetical protein
MLRSARESRGLDRIRIERDTRIRERYLSALERGAYDELPGDVYARGFLRSYAKYLGLDPDGMLALYRLETRATSAATSLGSGTRSRARATPGRAFVITPGVVTAAVLTILVGGLVAYFGYQLVTFSRTPDLRVLEPVGDVRGYDRTSIVITGVTAPNARVSVSGLAVNPSVLADDEGRFRLTVELAPGSNVVTLSAVDPRTRRSSADVTRRIEVLGDRDAGQSPPPASGAAG